MTDKRLKDLKRKELYYKIEHLEDELERFREAEHALSAAYLRIRTKLNAFRTPFAPTREQVWAHTEYCLDQLILKTLENKVTRKRRKLATHA